MKQKINILKFSFLFVLITTITSCKKYTCECSSYSSNNTEIGGRSSFTVKKRYQKEMCTDLSTMPDINGNFTSCVVK